MFSRFENKSCPNFVSWKLTSKIESTHRRPFVEIQLGGQAVKENLEIAEIQIISTPSYY